MSEVKTKSRRATLSEECLHAEGPSRDLDKLIAFGCINIAEADTAPRYTRELGTALSLVPRGERRVEFGTYGHGDAWAYIHMADGDRVAEADAATEALAICAAALSLAPIETGTDETRNAAQPEG